MSSKTTFVIEGFVAERVLIFYKECVGKNYALETLYGYVEKYPNITFTIRVADDPIPLAGAIKKAKVEAGLDPAKKYPVTKYSDHLSQYWLNVLMLKNLDTLAEIPKR